MSVRSACSRTLRSHGGNHVSPLSPLLSGTPASRGFAGYAGGSSFGEEE
jgi:hypothetical protein